MSRASTSSIMYSIKDVDGRAKPGHDEAVHALPNSPTATKCALRAAAAMSARLSLQMISKRPAAVPELGVPVGRWHGAYSSRSGSHGANHQRECGAAYTCLG